MSMFIIAALTATMLATALLSGIFGMAGGLILMGVLLFLLPLPDAMALHGVTQIASNFWRGALWFSYVHLRAAVPFLGGSALAFALWSLWAFVPTKPTAYLLLGVSPFLVRLAPAELKPDPERILHGTIYGAASMSLMLIAGVSGPLIDSFFLGGKLDRRQIVATKSVCQIVCHTAKFTYFGGLVAGAGGIDPVMAVFAIVASIAGTTLASPILERLSDSDYRTWASRIITVIACTYVGLGGYYLMN